MRVLYVEDEKFMAEAVKHNLEKNGFKVDLAFDGEDGLNAAVGNIYDCVILDVMLPKLSGIEVLARMREREVSTPVIILSALSEVEDKVRGLNAGADDYLAKPFKTAELVARINALVRRPAKMWQPVIKWADLEFDTEEKCLNGVTLTAKEAEILELLMRTPGKILKKEFLLGKVWGNDAYGEDNYIEVYVSRLRKMLKTLGSRAKISTVRGLGYKIIEE